MTSTRSLSAMVLMRWAMVSTVQSSNSSRMVAVCVQQGTVQKRVRCGLLQPTPSRQQHLESAHHLLGPPTLWPHPLPALEHDATAPCPCKATDAAQRSSCCPLLTLGTRCPPCHEPPPPLAAAATKAEAEFHTAVRFRDELLHKLNKLCVKDPVCLTATAPQRSVHFLVAVLLEGIQVKANAAAKL